MTFIERKPNSLLVRHNADLIDIRVPRVQYGAAVTDEPFTLSPGDISFRNSWHTKNHIIQVQAYWLSNQFGHQQNVNLLRKLSQSLIYWKDGITLPARKMIGGGLERKISYWDQVHNLAIEIFLTCIVVVRPHPTFRLTWKKIISQLSTGGTWHCPTKSLSFGSAWIDNTL